MVNKRKPLDPEHKRNISQGLKNFWRMNRGEILATGATTAIGTLGLIKARKDILKAAERGFEKGAREGVAQSAEALSKGFKEGAEKGIKDNIKPIEESFRKGVKQSVDENFPTVVQTVDDNIKQTKKEVVENLSAIVPFKKRKNKTSNAVKQKVSTAIEKAKTKKQQARETLATLDKENPWATNASIWERLRWQGKRDRQQIKAWTGFNKAQEEFWINFNYRRDLTDTESSDISFVVDKDKLYFSQRKPMSAATKKKISRSLARSKGSTAGYDSKDKTISDKVFDKFDSTVERIGKVAKAVSPVLRYINEKANIDERRKRRQLAGINTSIYGLGTTTRAASYFTISPSTRARMNLRRQLASDRLGLDTQKLNLSEKALLSREAVANNRLKLDRTKLGSFERQTKSQRMEVLRKMEIDRKSQEWQDLFNL